MGFNSATSFHHSSSASSRSTVTTIPETSPRVRPLEDVKGVIAKPSRVNGTTLKNILVSGGSHSLRKQEVTSWPNTRECSPHLSPVLALSEYGATVR
jgi:hypothetical protein